MDRKLKNIFKECRFLFTSAVHASVSDNSLKSNLSHQVYNPITRIFFGQSEFLSQGHPLATSASASSSQDPVGRQRRECRAAAPRLHRAAARLPSRPPRCCCCCRCCCHCCRYRCRCRSRRWRSWSWAPLSWTCTREGKVFSLAFYVQGLIRL